MGALLPRCGANAMKDNFGISGRERKPGNATLPSSPTLFVLRLCSKDNADEVVGRLLRQFDVVTGLSAWTDPRQIN